jgi:catechol 2,3-dioxygenase-like lactoylglutathione lyase family enzyme
MISGLDYIALAALSLDEAIADYERVLGLRADRSSASIRLSNLRLQFRPISSHAQGLCDLGFAVGDIGKARQLLERRTLITTGGNEVGALALPAAATHGVFISVMERPAGGDRAAPLPIAGTDPQATVTGLDHVVIRSPNPERAIALYAGRLGLSLRLDRTEPAWGARLLFFRCGDLIVEVAHDLRAGVGDGPDQLWGLSWRVPSVAAAHARLESAGVTVSGIRAGRRPGTQVLTVKSHTTGVPTLLIGPQSP